MATAGIDVGNATSCVALARKRGVDVIMNVESKRETPAIVSYGDKMRFVGVQGAARLTTNLESSVVQVKRLIGRKFQDPEVQADIKNFMFKVVEGPDGGCLINVTYLNQPRQFTPEQVMTSLLKDLKLIAEADQGSPITDCAISVPVYFTESERLAMLNAASLAGLKCLRLVNEPTATALNWGIFKSDLPEDQPLNVAFVDVGHSSLQVSIVAFKKGQMEVKAHSWDRNLGGRDLDNVLLHHFAGEFKAKTGLDVFKNLKAVNRLKSQIEKCRCQLTTNPKAPMDVECLMEDLDFRSEMTQEKFEELADPVLQRVRQPVMHALQMANLSAGDIASVELCGAASRTPAIVKTVAEVFGQDPKRTMNSKECVSRGCSLIAAMLSPLFQVRNFDVKDVYPFNVNITWEKEGAPATSQLFGAVEKDGVNVLQSYPCVKSVAFMKTEPFLVSAAYAEDSPVPPSLWGIANFAVTDSFEVPNGASRVSTKLAFENGLSLRGVAKFAVTDSFQVPDGASSVSTKLAFELDLNGLVRCTAATHHCKVETVEAPAPPAAEAAKAGDKPDAASVGDTVMTEEAEDGGSAPGEVATSEKGENGDASNMETDAPPKAQKQTKKVKKVSKPAKFEQQSLVALPMETYQRFLEEEGQMTVDDNLEIATAEAKNNLEEYLLALRSHLSDRYADFVKPADRDALVSELNALEDWLYEEGEDEKKSVYVSKLEELRRKGDPIKLLFDESLTRDDALQRLSNACQHNLAWCSTEDPKYAHITAEDRKTVETESQAALQWLEDTMRKQGALSKTEPPAELTSTIIEKERVLHNVCNQIIHKPAPPPPKAEPPAEEMKSAEEDVKRGEGAAAAPPEGALADGAPDGGSSPMETDTAAPAPA